MFSRRSLLKGLGWAGTAVGLSGMTQGLRSEQNRPSSQRQGKMWTVDPEAERLVHDYPARGVKKIWIPYPEREGKIKFPNNARVAALVFTSLDYIIAPPVRHRDALFKVDFWELSEGSEYTFEVGGWRALDVLEKNGVKSTVFANGFGLLKYPAIHKEFHRLGHEIAAHGWDAGKSLVMYTPQQEAECVRTTTDKVSEVIGERPVGWISPEVQSTERTFELLANAGYLWHGDLRDDDIPYVLKIGNKTLIEIPFRTMTTDDYGIWGPGARGRAGFDPYTAAEYFKEVLDLYLESAESEPLLLVFGIHPPKGCSPDRVRAVDQILKRLKSNPKVWVTQYKPLAEYWLKNYA